MATRVSELKLGDIYFKEGSGKWIVSSIFHMPSATFKSIDTGEELSVGDGSHLLGMFQQIDKASVSIDISQEDVFNLKLAIDKLLPISEPHVDLEIFTLKSIIERYENKTI